MEATTRKRYARSMNTSERTPTQSAGHLIREWRGRRRLSQLDLAAEAEISQRHLSFLESGRSRPSREMVLHLAERLSMPLRERNRLLVAAGFAPRYEQRALDDPSLAVALSAVEQVLSGHEPNPAMAVDRHWNLVRANRAIESLVRGIADPGLLAAPANMLRLSLHPQGLAPLIVNLLEWRDHCVERLQRLNRDVADPVLGELERELRSYPMPKRSRPAAGHSPIAAMLQLRHRGRVLSFITTITVFGTPLDVTLSELAIESFFPADTATAAAMRELAQTA
jgi:transcriptional regulator with XRE-family HTH domain